MSRKNHTLLLALILFVSACSMQPTQVIEPLFTPTPAAPPLTEADVPRVTVQEAQAALASGEAVMVDVRSAGAFETSHIIGALNIPLDKIETNPTSLDLPKDQWIITYCT